MIIYGKQLTDKHINEQAVILVGDEPLLGWIVSGKDFLSETRYVLYNHITNEVNPIYPDTKVTIIRFKYVVTENILSPGIMPSMVISQEGISDVINEFINNGMRIEKYNDYTQKVYYKDRLIYYIFKLPEDIYMPTWYQILNKYKDNVAD